jgi:O-antigen/teichoic acid export membrane protein
MNLPDRQQSSPRDTVAGGRCQSARTLMKSPAHFPLTDTATTLRRTALSSVKWSLLGEAVTQFLSIALLLILARILGPEPFGLIAIASALLGILSSLATLGMSEALVQRKTIHDRDLSTAFWTMQLIALVAGAIIWYAAPSLSRLFGMEELEPILYLLSISPLFGTLGAVHAALLQRDMAFRPLATRQILSSLLGGAAGLAAAAAGLGVWALVIQRLLAGLVGTVAVWLAHPWRPRFRYSLASFRGLASYGTLISVQGLLGQAGTRVEHLLVGFLLPPLSVGFYSLAKQIFVTVIAVVNVAIHSVAFSGFSRIQQDRGKLAHAFLYTTRNVTLITAPTFIFIAYWAAEIVTLLLGSRWAGAGGVVSVIACTGVMTSTLWMTGTVFAARAKNLYNITALSAEILTTLVAIWIAAPFGVVGVAMGPLLARVAIAPLRFHLLGRIIRIDFRSYIRALLPGFLAGLGVVAAGIIWTSVNITSSVIATLLGAAVCTILVVVLLLLGFQRRLVGELACDLLFMLSPRRDTESHRQK